MNKMPEHLQNLMDEKEQEFVVRKQKDACNATELSFMRYGFEKGYEAMYETMLKEMEPLVEAMKSYFKLRPMGSHHLSDCIDHGETDEGDFCPCIYITTEKILKSLSEYRERIKGRE